MKKQQPRKSRDLPRLIKKNNKYQFAYNIKCKQMVDFKHIKLLTNQRIWFIICVVDDSSTIHRHVEAFSRFSIG